MKTGITGCLIALRTAGIAGCLAALSPACLASRLTALCLAGIARLASCLAALCLASIARVTSILVTSIAGILTASCPAGVTRCLATIRTARIVSHARTRAGSSKTLGALLRLTAARLISDAAKWLGWTFDSDSDGAIEICVRYVGLSSAGSRKLHVQVKLVPGSSGSCGARVFDDCIFFDADPGSLEAHHRALLRWDRFCKCDVFQPELGIICEGTVKVEPSPPFAVALSGQTFQYDHIGWGSRWLRAQLVYMRILIEKSFFTSISFLGSHMPSSNRLLKCWQKSCRSVGKNYADFS